MTGMPQLSFPCGKCGELYKETNDRLGAVGYFRHTGSFKAFQCVYPSILSVRRDAVSFLQNPESVSEILWHQMTIGGSHYLTLLKRSKFPCDFPVSPADGFLYQIPEWVTGNTWTFLETIAAEAAYDTRFTDRLPGLVNLVLRNGDVLLIADKSVLLNPVKVKDV